MSKWGSKHAMGPYIDLIAGADTPHAVVAERINTRVEGARIAGSLVGRWRKGEVDGNPGNLSALAIAYDRNPIEAFVVAGLLDEEYALPALTPHSVQLLGQVRLAVTVDQMAQITGKLAPTRRRRG